MRRRLVFLWLGILVLIGACAAPAATPVPAPTPTQVVPTSAPPTAVPPTQAPATPSSSTAVPATVVPTTIPPTGVPPTVAPPAAPVAGQLATLGQEVFARYCSSCHGSTGQGRTAQALIGSSARLDKYGSAQALLEYITRAMPSNARGSLKADEYFQVLAHLLVENKIVSADQPLEASMLATILLKP